MTRAYAEYRASGIPWVYRIPHDWVAVPLASVLSESKVKNVGLVETNLLSLSYGRIVRKDIEAPGGLLPESFETYQIVEPDYLVFRFTDLQNDQRSLRSARVSERGIITSAYASAKPHGIDPRYAEYLMRSYDTTKVFYALGGGVRQSLKFADVARLPVLLPPESDQRAIADYLDRETARIDTLIKEQQRLVETLLERRAAVIDNGVFGLDGPGAGDRQPPVIGRHRAVEPLLKRCPDTWKTVRFKVALDRLDERNEDLSQPMMSLKSSGQVVPRDGGRQEPDEKSLPRYLVARKGDLVVNPMWLIGGAIGVSEVDGAVSPDYRVFRSRGAHNPRYLHHLLRSRPYIDQYLLYTRAQTTFDRRVQQSDLGNLPLPVPPIAEQAAIAEQIDEQIASIDVLIKETDRLVELVRERRATLITAVATGQVDVRHEVA